MLDISIAEAGIPTLGYFAQVPHSVNGEYPAAAVALVLLCPAAPAARVDSVRSGALI